MRSPAFSEMYKRKCFDIWYLQGCPNVAVTIQDMLPLDEKGRKPSTQKIRKWLPNWIMKADELDQKVEEENDAILVNEKLEILKRHQEQAIKAQSIALAYIEKEGFDSSSSAVQALFRGMEEERKTQGFSDLLERLDSMTNNQVRDQIINLINRATENNQIVEEGEAVVGLLEDDTLSEEEE